MTKEPDYRVTISNCCTFEGWGCPSLLPFGMFLGTILGIALVFVLARLAGS
jgi:hypothetical protein